MMKQATDFETIDWAWKPLCKVGGAAALAILLLMAVQIAVFEAGPPPSTVTGWFELFQKSPLLGLLDMDLLLIVDQVLMALVFLALYVTLRWSRQPFMAIALAFALLGIAAYFASATAFEMLSLSGKYAAATAEAERSVLLAAGEVALATWQGTAFNVGYVLEGAALLITALVMLRSDIFSKETAYVGIVLGVMSLVPPTVPAVGMFFALGSLTPLAVWLLLVARRLFQLGRAASEGKLSIDVDGPAIGGWVGCQVHIFSSTNAWKNANNKRWNPDVLLSVTFAGERVFVITDKDDNPVLLRTDGKGFISPGVFYFRVPWAVRGRNELVFSGEGLKDGRVVTNSKTIPFYVCTGIGVTGVNSPPPFWSKSPGKVAERLRVYGTGFGRHGNDTDITVMWDGLKVVTGIDTDSDGRWQARFKIPPWSEPGPHTVKATSATLQREGVTKPDGTIDSNVHFVSDGFYVDY